MTVPDDLILAAKRARALAATLTSPESKTAFLEMAEKWEAEAARTAPPGDPAGSGKT